MRLSKLTTTELIIRAEVQAQIDAIVGKGGIDVVALLEELIDRRGEAESELRLLERGVAYTAACSIIDGCCGPTGQAEWFDTGDAAEFSREAVDEAVRYLTLRGLIETDPAHPTWIAMRNESEATA